MYFFIISILLNLNILLISPLPSYATQKFSTSLPDKFEDALLSEDKLCGNPPSARHASITILDGSETFSYHKKNDLWMKKNKNTWPVDSNIPVGDILDTNLSTVESSGTYEHVGEDFVRDYKEVYSDMQEDEEDDDFLEPVVMPSKHINDEFDINKDYEVKPLKKLEVIVVSPDNEWNKEAKFQAGTTVQYTCKSGYDIKEDNAGGSRLVCRNGQWLGRLPACVSRGCGKPPRIVSGYYLHIDKMKDSANILYPYYTGTKVQALCHVGFDLRGPDVFKCSKEGVWLPRHRARCSPSHIIMKSSLCPSPAAVENAVSTVVRGVVSTDGAVHNTAIHHTCDVGYRDKTINACNTTYMSVCYHGEWRGIIPKCEKFYSCLPPPEVHHSVLYQDSSQYMPGQRLYYYCQSGYQLQGPSVLECQESSGCWSPIHFKPLCIPEVAVTGQESLLLNSDGLTRLDLHTLLVAVTGSILAVLLVAIAALLYHRTLNPKRRRRLHNSSSNTGADNEGAVENSSSFAGVDGQQPSQQQQPQQQQQQNILPAHQSIFGSCSSQCPQQVSVPQHQPSGPPAGAHSSARLLVKHYNDQGGPPSYEESIRQHRPVFLEHPSNGGNRPLRSGSGRAAAGRVVMGGMRRSRHRDNPDNISYQSIGSARHSAASMRSWSACDSLGSTDTVHAPGGGDTGTCSSSGVGPPSIGGTSESTNVTLDTLSTLSSAAVSQAASCRALFGSRTSFDSSSVVTNEGAPLLEECEEGCCAGGSTETSPPIVPPDQLSQGGASSEDRDTRSPAFSLNE